MKTARRVFLAGLILSAANVMADPPVAFPPGIDLDGSGAFETEFSSLGQTFLAPPSGGRISFDWQLFSSEFFGGGAEDVFYVRLINNDNGTIVDEVNGALDPTPAGYSGTFTPIGAPPMGTTGSSEATAGPPGLMFDAFHLDGGTGWMTSFLSIPPSPDGMSLSLVALVADTFDRNADTSLAIDNISALAVTGAPIPSLSNPGFESLLTDWTVAGNGGIYSLLTDLFVGGPEPGTGPTQGDFYALISTAGVVPEPHTATLLLFGALALLIRRRR